MNAHTIVDIIYYLATGFKDKKSCAEGFDDSVTDSQIQEWKECIAKNMTLKILSTLLFLKTYNLSLKDRLFAL